MQNTEVACHNCHTFSTAADPGFLGRVFICIKGWGFRFANFILFF